MKRPRKPLQGVLNILDFNRHFYYFGAALIIVVLVVGFYFQWQSTILIAASIIVLTGLVLPLVVSFYVYDLSGYYQMQWLDRLFRKKNKLRQVVNIHAGFDETSAELEENLPNAQLQVFDFYDPKKHTEVAIRRARKKSRIHPSTISIHTNKIPLQSNSQDAVFLLSAAHEIRNFEEKVRFLRECRRITKENEPVILVEHLRDVPNFLAFHIGYTHFFSRKTWLKAFHAAGFRVIREKKHTPFLSIFKATS